MHQRQHRLPPDDALPEIMASLVRQLTDYGEKQAEIVNRLAMLRQQAVKLLAKQYAASVQKPAELAGPKKLLEEEAVLLVALSRNKYVVSGEKGGSGQWFGMVDCYYHLRASSFIWCAESRLELLRQCWQCASEQDEVVSLTEDDLQGGLWLKQLQALLMEYHQQHHGDLDESLEMAE